VSFRVYKYRCVCFGGIVFVCVDTCSGVLTWRRE